MKSSQKFNEERLEFSPSFESFSSSEKKKKLKFTGYYKKALLNWILKFLTNFHKGVVTQSWNFHPISMNFLKYSNFFNFLCQMTATTRLFARMLEMYSDSWLLTNLWMNFPKNFMTLRNFGVFFCGIFRSILGNTGKDSWNSSKFPKIKREMQVYGISLHGILGNFL